MSEVTQEDIGFMDDPAPVEPVDTTAVPVDEPASPAQIVQKPQGKAVLEIGKRGVQLQTLPEVIQFAQGLVGSGMYQMSQAEAIGVITKGMEVGLGPHFSMSNIAPIKGKYTLWGDALPALVYSSGLMHDFFEEITGEGDDMVATCRVKRKGMESAITKTFSVADAKRAGLWGKGTWTAYPRVMLERRARAFAFRAVFPDVLGGLYISEEFGAVRIDGETYGDDKPARQVTNTRRDMTDVEPAQFLED